MARSKRLRVLRVLAWLALLTPLAWLAWRYRQDQLGANPIELLLLWSGRSGLILLLTSLAVTPVRRLTGWNEVQKVRRFLGLSAFFYITTHFLMYVGLDQFFALGFILEDIAERPFITVGFAAWLLLIPLAVTSTRGWIRRLGRRWTRLHRVVYVAASLGTLHYFWNVKADTRWPLVAAGVLTVMLLMRLPPVSAAIVRARSRLQSATS